MIGHIMRRGQNGRGIGAARAALAALLALAAPAAPAAGQCLEAGVLPPAAAGAPGGGWQFGFAVDVSGDRLIVGAPGESDDPHAQSGFGLYERSGASWTLVFDGFREWGDEDAGFDVAIAGDWAAVGAPCIATSPARAGQVLVLHRAGGLWRLTQRLASVADHGEQFGISVDLDGGLLAVGQRAESAGAPPAPAPGAAHVFRLAGDTWVLDQLVEPSSAAARGFGRAVAVLDSPDRSLLIVGEPGHSVFGGDDGAAHVFRREPGAGWMPIALLESFLHGARLGTSVALSNAFAVAGGPFADAGSFLDEGLLVVARWNGAGYGNPLPIPGTAGELAGWSLAADDHRLYSGSPGWTGLYGDANATGLIAGHEFVPSPPAWQLWPNGASLGVVPIGEVVSRDGVGLSVAVDGSSLVLGTPGRDGSGADASLPDTGAVWIYDLSVPAWEWDDLSIEGALGPSGTATLFAEGSLCAGDGVALHLHKALPNTLVALVLGFSKVGVPFLGGTLIPSPDRLVVLPTDAAGDVHLLAKFPDHVPPGTNLWMHAWWPDPGGPQGFAASNATHGVTH